MPTIKEPTIKQKFVLFYFYFSFIAVVQSTLCSSHRFFPSTGRDHH